MTELGRRIRAGRKTLKLTQAEFAQRLGTSEPAVRNWESGKNPPSDRNLREVSDLIGISIETLLAPGLELPAALKPKDTPAKLDSDAFLARIDRLTDLIEKQQVTNDKQTAISDKLTTALMDQQRLLGREQELRADEQKFHRKTISDLQARVAQLERAAKPPKHGSAADPG